MEVPRCLRLERTTGASEDLSHAHLVQVGAVELALSEDGLHPRSSWVMDGVRRHGLFYRVANPGSKQGAEDRDSNGPHGVWNVNGEAHFATTALQAVDPEELTSPS